jgi:hypothetical protein
VSGGSGGVGNTIGNFSSKHKEMSSSSGISHKPPTQVNKSVRPSSANSNPFPGLTTPSADYTNPFNYEFGDAGSSSSKKRKAVDADFNSNLKTYEHSLKSSRMSVGGSGGVRVGSSGEVGTEHPNYHQMRIKLEEEKLREELLAFNANRLSQAQQNKQTQQATVIKKAPPSLSQLTPVSSSSSATTSSSSSSAKSSSIIKKPAIPTTASHSHSHSHLQQALSSSTTINSSQLAKKMKMISPGSGQSSSGARNENPRTAVAESADDSSFKSSVTQIFGTAVTEVVSNQLWICPSCNRHDESTPMIGCDSCDDWYHW